VKLDIQDRAALLAAARAAVEAAADGREASWATDREVLRESRGAFVTLRHRDSGELRGCIGYVEPRYPLVEAVARAAAAAARDDRFDPVTPDEVPSLEIQVSVLGRLEPISPDRVVAGTHGLVIRRGSRMGLLLPQVAPEQGWGREELLAGTCRKAGLPPEAWRLPDVELRAFTATVFVEE
jgi:AmmeMemoRadiSam system protein A